MSPKDNDHWFADDELVHEEGILVAASGGHTAGCDEDECAPDETVEDAINEPGVSGTVDDLPYDFGVEPAQAADETFESLEGPPLKAWRVGATGPADDDVEPGDLGRPEERELWSKQRHLIEESEANEREYGHLPEEKIPEIVAASGEDAEEVLPQSPDGASATGALSE